jgi:hypothetical protein
MEEDFENDSIFSPIDKYLSVPTTTALVPINPAKIPSYYLGSVFTSDQRFQRNDFMQLFLNVESSLEYFSSSHNDAHYNNRFQKFIFDTMGVNAICEIPSDIGSIFASTYANDMTAQYANEIVEDELNKSLETEFSQTLPGSKSGGNSTTPPLFNGIGFFKEHIPVSERTNPFTGPTLLRGRNRPLWSYKFFGGSAYIMSNTDIGIRLPTKNLRQKVIFKGCGLQILKYGINLLLIVSYLKYPILLKELIAGYGIQYLNLFKGTFLKIIWKWSKSILKKIGKVKNKIRKLSFNRKRSKRKGESFLKLTRKPIR